MTFTKEKKENYFLSQPHQPFFVLAIINAIIMMLVFALANNGVITLQVSSLLFHTYTLIYGLFLNVFTGFLFTTFPRFCQSEVLKKEFYIQIFSLNAIGSIIFIVASMTSLYMTFASMILLFISNLFMILKLRHILKVGTSPAKEDPYWILMSCSFGLVAHLLFIISLFYSPLENLAIKTAFYMYVIFLTFSIAQRMIPFFCYSTEQKDLRFVSTVFVFMILKTVLSVLNEYSYVKVAEIVVSLILALYLFGEFIRWKLPISKSEPIIWVLILGLLWLSAAFFIDAIVLSAEVFLGISFYYLGVHALGIGFLTTILIGFATRIILGHSGQIPNTTKFDVGIFYFIQVVVVLRVLYSINVGSSLELDFLFDISISAWIILFLLWGGKFLPILIFGAKK
ncbi:MAG: NnrS family protein [Sulfurimonas sp.]|nr:NnrS family protein [Sulfurimonas sp.]